MGTLKPEDPRLFYERMYQASRMSQEAWGEEPAPLVTDLINGLSLSDKTVLDLGAGEGKNAIALADAGARVVAVDYSQTALQSASERWGSSVSWIRADASKLPFRLKGIFGTTPPFSVVVMQGLLLCYQKADPALRMLRDTRRLTRGDGLHIVSTFNNHSQEGLAEAHHGTVHWMPPHYELLELYEKAGWQIMPGTVEDYDYDLPHPPDYTDHRHSMTRFMAWKPPKSGVRLWDRRQWDRWYEQLQMRDRVRVDPRFPDHLPPRAAFTARELETIRLLLPLAHLVGTQETNDVDATGY